MIKRATTHYLTVEATVVSNFAVYLKQREDNQFVKSKIISLATKLPDQPYERKNTETLHSMIDRLIQHRDDKTQRFLNNLEDLETSFKKRQDQQKSWQPTSKAADEKPTDFLARNQGSIRSIKRASPENAANERKFSAAKQKKEAILQSKKAQAEQKLVHTEMRIKIREGIMARIQTYRRKAFLVKTWNGMIQLKKVCQLALSETTRRKREAEFFSRVMWIAVKMICKQRIWIKRFGKPAEQRIRQQIK
jgi:hypothetical protein